MMRCARSTFSGLAFLAVAFLPEARADNDDVPAPGEPAAVTESLTPAEDLAGWKLLTGPDAAQHWRRYRGGDFPEGGWTITPRGSLRLSGGGGDLVTNEEFENFELVFEWRTGHRGNSGVMYRVREDHPAPWQSGPEYQLLDDEGHGASATADWSAGALYGIASPRPGKRLQPTGRFNHGRIVLDEGRLEHWVNGRLVVEIPDLDDPSFRRRVERSKFAEYEGFATSRKGRIALQDHGDAFEFRRMRIRPLPPSDQRDPSMRRVQPPMEVLGSLTGLLIRADEEPPTLLFLGDDLMAGWRDAGRETWDRGLAQLGAVSLAVNGETPAHTLFKLDYPQFLAEGPRAIMIRYGEVERHMAGADAPAIVRTMAELISVIRTRSPDSIVLLHVPDVGSPEEEGYAVRSRLRELLPMLADGTTVRALLEDGPRPPSAAMYANWKRGLTRVLAEYGIDLNVPAMDVSGR